MKLELKKKENWTNIEHLEKHKPILLNKYTKIFPKQANKFNKFLTQENEENFDFDFDVVISSPFIYFFWFELPK